MVKTNAENQQTFREVTEECIKWYEHKTGVKLKDLREKIRFTRNWVEEQRSLNEKDDIS